MYKKQGFHMENESLGNIKKMPTEHWNFEKNIYMLSENEGKSPMESFLKDS